MLLFASLLLSTSLALAPFDASAALDSPHRHVRSQDRSVRHLVKRGFSHSTTFRNLMARLEQSDVIVYFAGHGASDRDGTPLLLPFDADVNYPRETAMQLAVLYSALAKLPARRIIVVIDACFSGVSRGGTVLSDGARPIVVSIEHPALLRDGMVVFAAAQGAQTANDLPEKQHGLFSYQFFRALRGAADADADGSLTVDEVDTFVTRETRAAAAHTDREQVPLVIARERSLRLVRVPSAASKK